MAASNRDLPAEVEAGTFRPDLYYRLGVVSLEIPALRDRRDDIPDLVYSYIDHFARTIGRDVTGITPLALRALVRAPWPGNVRELVNVIERAVLLCEGEEIDGVDLPVRDESSPPDGVAKPDPSHGTARDPRGAWLDQELAEARREALDAFERAYLSAHLLHTQGRVGETARRIGIRPRSLYEKMRRLGLRKEDFRRG